jgi:Tol biopolymer transport system component/DNA-binding winged helix-turn-helix (wHTH) protein
MAEDKSEAVPKPAEAGGRASLSLHFGAFTVDRQRHGLYREGQRIHLTPKPFETLVVLVEHSGTTVPKQKLLDAVWKDAFVTEDSLVKAVREIRRALDDEKASPRFIQTVPGEGYRFIAEVTPVSPEVEAQRRAELQPAEVGTTDAQRAINSTPGSRHRTTRAVRNTSAVLVLLGAIAVGFLWRPWRDSESPAQRLISSFRTARTSVDFSPDGNWVTFIADVAGVPQVWIKRLGGGEPVQITSGDIPASHPRWSPRNDEILFSGGTASQSIWSVPPFGGLAATLLIEGAYNASWSSDGNRLVFEMNDEIWTANADGTNRQRVDGVPRVDLLIMPREPSFSPDGSQIAFFQPDDGPMGDIWVIPSTGGQAKRLTFDNHLGGGLVWTPHGDYIVFSSQRGGSKTLWKIHRSGGSPKPVLNSPGEDTNPDISSDGGKLIYATTRNHWVLTIKDVASGRIQELKESRTDMFSPSFSPQGDKIAFFATVDGGDIHVFTVRTDGQELTQVTRGKRERNVMPSWSADGSFLYFYQVRPTLAFRRIPAEGGISLEIARGWRWRSHNAAQVDPRGKRIVYTKLEKGRSVATLVRDMVSGTESVLNPTLDSPRWSSDGKFIVGVDLAGTAPGDVFGDIVVCAVESGACRRVATRGADPIWSADDSRICFDRWKSMNSREVWAVSPAGEDERRIVEREQLDPIATFYDMSRAGQVVYVQFKQGQQELWLTDFNR